MRSQLILKKSTMHKRKIKVNIFLFFPQPIVLYRCWWQRSLWCLGEGQHLWQVSIDQDAGCTQPITWHDVSLAQYLMSLLLFKMVLFKLLLLLLLMLLFTSLLQADGQHWAVHPTSVPPPVLLPHGPRHVQETSDASQVSLSMMWLL